MIFGLFAAWGTIFCILVRIIKSWPWAGRLQPMGLRWLAACFCMACNLSMVFAFWNGWLKIKRRVLFRDMWETYEIQIFMSTVTFYWRPAISFVFLYCQWLLLHYNESWVVVTEMALKAPNVYYLALYGKNWSTSVVDHCRRNICLPVDQMGA